MDQFGFVEAVDRLGQGVVVAVALAASLGDAEGGGFRLDWNGPELADRLKSPTELVAILEGALNQIAAVLGADPATAESTISEFAPLLAAAAARLLAMTPPTIAPQCAIDAILRVCEWRADLGYRERPPQTAQAMAELHRTPERRRAAFWRAAERFGPEILRIGIPLEHLHQMRHCGWTAGLVPIDIDWLLADAPLRPLASERKLAINTALQFCLGGEPTDVALKQRIEQVALQDVDMTKAYVATTTPYVKSVSEMALEQSMEDSAKQGLQRRPLLPIIRRAMTDSRGPPILSLALERFRSNADPSIAAQYLGVAYAIDARIATDALMAVLESLDPTSKTKLVERALPQIFGSRWSRWEPAVSVIDFETLERLVQLAYQEVRIEFDRDRTREVFSPDERDNAEEARSAAFNFLVESPGREAFDAIQRLAKDPKFPIPPQRMTELAERRACADSDGIPWSPNQVHEFEMASEHPPMSTHELQLVAVNRLNELQHDLLHGDFQQGTVLRLLPNERDVQNWLAERLREVQRRSYSVEREVHVTGEKEPDIRFRAKASDASVAMEIKATASGWTFEQLEDALENQLCGQYLRARDGREGIFLIVHQHPRPVGWNVSNEGFIDFPEVVRRLQASAERIRQRSASGPQPVVVAIDVSSCVPAKATKGSANPAAADPTPQLKQTP